MCCASSGARQSQASPHLFFIILWRVILKDMCKVSKEWRYSLKKKIIIIFLCSTDKRKSYGFRVMWVSKWWPNIHFWFTYTTFGPLFLILSFYFNFKTPGIIRLYTDFVNDLKKCHHTINSWGSHTTRLSSYSEHLKHTCASLLKDT